MRKTTTLMALMVALTAFGTAATQTWAVDGQSAWEAGTFNQTTFDSDADGLVLSTVQPSLYADNGSYRSAWHDWGDTANITEFTITDTVPANTSVSYWLRSSSDGTNDTASDWYNRTTAVPDDQFVQFRAVLDTANNSTTPAVDRVNVTAEIAGSAGITLTQTPDDPTTDQTPHFEGETESRTNVEYRVDGGSWERACNNCETFAFDVGTELSGGEHTVEVQTATWWGESQSTSDTFSVADGTEFSFSPAYTTTYPASALPIDVDSSIWAEDTDVDFNFTLVGPETFDISNRYGDGVCDLRGLEEWPIDEGEGDNYCGTEVPSGVALGSYDLQVTWRLQGETHSGFVGPDGGLVSQSNAMAINVDEIGDWVSQSSSHGGHLQDSSSISHNANFDQDTSKESGTIYTCPGATLNVNSIGSVTVQCTNGATGGSPPPGVVAFISRGGTEITSANNNLFGGGCSIDTTRAVLQGEVDQAGQDRSQWGYNPGCNLQWQMDGSSTSFDAHTFSDTGEYTVNVDFINAVSDSPDYICPADGSNSQCNVGSMSGDQHGWEQLDSYSIDVVDPELSDGGMTFSNSVNTTVDGTTWIRRDDYNESMTVTWTLDNTGIGDVAIESIDLNCPDGMTCSKPSVTTIAEGESAQLVFTVDSTDGVRGQGAFQVEVDYSDNHGLSCIGTHTFQKEVRFDERGPTASVTGRSGTGEWYNATSPNEYWFTETPVSYSLSCSDSGVGCDTTEWCVDQSDSCTPSESLPVSINGSEGLNHVRYRGTDLLGNVAPTASDALRIDTEPPVVDCQDCVQPETAETREQVLMEPEVMDAGIGVDTIDICGDRSCSQIFCSLGQSGSCSYSSQEQTSSEVWVRARDRLGRQTDVQIGSFEILLSDGAFCRSDSQCLSNTCTQNTCQPDRVPPEIVIQ